MSNKPNCSKKRKPIGLSRIEEADKERKGMIEYSIPTKIGYWLDQLAAREYKMDLIKQKRARCETLTMRMNMMRENLLKPGLLAQPNPYIHYGDAIQITTDEIQTTKLGIQKAALAPLITEKDIDSTFNLCHGCPVLASFNTTPCRRNLFCIIDPEDPECTRKNQRMEYGRDVYICLKDSGFDKRKLYLRATVPTINEFGEESNHYPLLLSECPDRYCKFKTVHRNPDERVVSFGNQVPSNTTICLAHTVTNRFIVTERKYIQTLFGIELEVSCFNFVIQNREVPSNLWEFTILKQKELIKPSSLK